MLNFKQWLVSEWEGFNFSQEPDMVNGPAYAERGIRSKYKGPGKKQPDPREGDPAKPEGNKLRKSFGFDKADFLLALTKAMSKKMGKR